MTDKQIFESFVSQFTDSRNKNSEVNSLDMRYVFDLQKERLAQNNLVMKYNFRKETFHNAFAPSGWSNNEYQTYVVYRSYEIIKEFLVNNSVKFRKKKNEFFYAVVTDMKNEHSEKTACCPNCGAIHTIKTLLHEGCPNCRTRFVMNDIYPKVTNYFSAKDYSDVGEKLPLTIKKFIFGGAVAGVVVNMISVIKSGYFNDIFTDPSSLIGLIFIIAGSAAAGAFFSYLLWAVIQVSSIVIDAVKSVPKLAAQNDAQKRIPAFMEKFDPNFSYQIFVGKAISLMKIMIFSPDYSNLAVYEGKETENKFKDIVDVHFNSAMRFNNCKFDGIYAYLDVTIYTINTYFVNNQIKEKNEKFRLVLCKNMRIPPDYGFSLKKVMCRGCGGSFDATRERNCPYCGNDYRLAEDDWAVLHFQKEE